MYIIYLYLYYYYYYIYIYYTVTNLKDMSLCMNIKEHYPMVDNQFSVSRCHFGDKPCSDTPIRRKLTRTIILTIQLAGGSSILERVSTI